MKRPSNVQSATHISSWLTSWDRNQLRNACIRGLSSSLLAGTDAMNCVTACVIGTVLGVVVFIFCLSWLWGARGPTPLHRHQDGAEGRDHGRSCRGQMSPAPKLMNNPENRQSATMAPAWTRWRDVEVTPSAAACGSASALRLARSIASLALAS